MRCLLVLITLLFAATNAVAVEDLIQESTTHLRVTPVLNPIVQERLFDGQSLIPQDVAWAFGVAVEVPISDWLNSGFLMQFNTGLPGFIPVSDLSAFAKFQWPFAFGTGNFAPYLLIPLGFSYTTVPVVDQIALRSSTDAALKTKLYDNGVGFNGALALGFEFFPIRYIGAYVEAGYRASVLFHQIVKGVDWERTWDYGSYWIRGATLSFGTKIAF